MASRTRRVRAAFPLSSTTPADVDRTVAAVARAIADDTAAV
jgi:hypothetical protein